MPRAGFGGLSLLWLLSLQVQGNWYWNREGVRVGGCWDQAQLGGSCCPGELAVWFGVRLKGKVHYPCAAKSIYAGGWR